MALGGGADGGALVDCIVAESGSRLVVLVVVELRVVGFNAFEKGAGCLCEEWVDRKVDKSKRALEGGLCNLNRLGFSFPRPFLP